MTYEEFIQNILNTRGRFACGEEYHERHHIKPKCMGGTNDEDNLIDLYAREHYEAHRLLALENPNQSKLTYAWWLMSNMKNDCEKRHELTAEEYEEARVYYSKTRSESIIGDKHPNFGKHLSDEHKQKLSTFHTGKKLSQQTIEKISLGHKGLATGSKNPMSKKVSCEGKIFGCIADCAAYYDVTVGAMKMWLRGKNRMPQSFIDKNLRYLEKEQIEYEPQFDKDKNKGKNNHNSKKVKCGDMIFECALDCAKYYQIKKNTMYAWLSGVNNMPQKFKELNLSYLEGGEEL